MDKHKIKKLPPCSQRFGRFWDDCYGKKRAVITCGGMREVDSEECMICGGHEVMLKNKVTGFDSDDYKILKCSLKLMVMKGIKSKI